MLFSANVEIDRQTLEGLLLREHFLPVLRVDVSHEVPRAIHESVHSVGLPARGPTALRARRVHPIAGVYQGQTLVAQSSVQFGKHHGKLVSGHGLTAALVAVDHRYRRAPVPLPRDQPVPQPRAHRVTPDFSLFRRSKYTGPLFLEFTGGIDRCRLVLDADGFAECDIGFGRARYAQVVVSECGVRQCFWNVEWEGKITQWVEPLCEDERDVKLEMKVCRY